MDLGNRPRRNRASVRRPFVEVSEELFGERHPEGRVQQRPVTPIRQIEFRLVEKFVDHHIIFRCSSKPAG